MAEYKSKSRAPSFLSRFSPTTPHPSIPRSLSIPSIYSPFPFFSYSSSLLSIFPISCVPLYHHHRNRPLFYFPLPSCLAPLVYTSCVQRDSRNSIFLPTTPSYPYSIRVSRLVLFFSLNSSSSLSAIIRFTPRPNWTGGLSSSLLRFAFYYFFPRFIFNCVSPIVLTLPFSRTMFSRSFCLSSIHYPPLLRFHSSP